MNYRDVERARDRFKDAEREYKEACDSFCKKHCPVSVGDLVTVNAYAHAGKQFIAEEIFLRESWAGTEFHASGAIIKKDGTKGIQRGHWRMEVDDGN